MCEGALHLTRGLIQWGEAVVSEKPGNSCKFTLSKTRLRREIYADPDTRQGKPEEESDEQTHALTHTDKNNNNKISEKRDDTAFFLN